MTIAQTLKDFAKQIKQPIQEPSLIKAAKITNAAVGLVLLKHKLLNK